MHICFVLLQDVVDIEGTIPYLFYIPAAVGTNNLLTEAIPYPNIPKQDLSNSMKQNGFDVKKMFQSANEFFIRMGLINIPPSIWNNSIIQKPDDEKNISCQATSWDFYDGKVILTKRIRFLPFHTLINVTYLHVISFQ